MSEEKVCSLGELGKLCQQFLQQYPKGAVVALSGELGAGKTTFVRHCIECISAHMNLPCPRVTSPSFVIHQSYPELKPTVEHFDLYRLENVGSDQLLEIGYFDALERAAAKQGFVFLEWPEKVSDAKDLRADLRIEIEIQPESRVFKFEKSL